MRHQNPTLSLLLLPSISIIFAAFLFYPGASVSPQTPNKNFNASSGRPSRKAIKLPPRPTSTPKPESSEEVVKVDVDLVKVDALVMQKNTARIVGGLKKEDFQIYEDGTSRELDSKPGVVRWTELPTRHIAENIGSTESHTLLVEIK